MKFTSFAIITGALIFGLVGCSEKKTEADAAAPAAVASNTDAAAPAKDAAATTPKTGEVAPVTAPPATDGKPAPSQPPKDNPKRGTAPDAPGQSAPDVRPADPVNPQKDAPKPMVAPGKGTERYATPKGENKPVPMKPGQPADTKATSEPVAEKKPTMKPLVNWKAPSASGNVKPYTGTWSMQIGPKMAELNAKLKKMGKTVPKFEFSLNPNGTFKFSQGGRMTTGVIQVNAGTVKLMPTAINGQKPRFEPEVRPYEFKFKDGAMLYMLNGRPGTKFVRS